MNRNWKKTREGWVKKDKSVEGGSSPYNRPEPIVRDDAGRPLRSDRVSIDTKKWIEEVNSGKWPPK